MKTIKQIEKEKEQLEQSFYKIMYRGNKWNM